MKKGFKNTGGFTLIEILVVLVIIGILVAVILPNALSSIDSGNIKKAASDLRNIDTAAALCYSQTQTWTGCGSNGVNDLAGYLNAGSGGTSAGVVPSDPWGGAYKLAGDTTSGFYSLKTDIFPNWPSLTGVNRV